MNSRTMFGMFRMVLWLMLAAAPCALAQDAVLECRFEGIHEKYQAMRAELQDSQFGPPFVIRSSEDKKRMSGDVYSLMNHPFKNVKDALKDPNNWRDILPLHFNVKACACVNQENGNFLTIYVGRKFYQKPEDVRQIQYAFRCGYETADYLGILLVAEKGPYRTKDYRIELEAIPAGEGKTFLRLGYGFSHGLMMKTILKTYLATLGRNKIGFTVTGRDRSGNPEYIGGVMGMIERNAARYYFAIQAYLDTLRYTPEKRFDMRLERWFDLTARFPDQLYEMSREDYIRSKRTEQENRLLLEQGACPLQQEGAIFYSE